MSPQRVKQLVIVIENNGENSCPKMLGGKTEFVVQAFHREAEQITDLRLRQVPLNMIAILPNPAYSLTCA